LWPDGDAHRIGSRRLVETYRPVKTFQGLDLGTLTVDGIVGPKTWTKLLAMWLSGSEPG
jgi:hypothetical protein